MNVDQQLVEKAQQGGRDAFLALCEQCGKDVLYICIKTMGNRHDGEDAAQEVLLSMQKSISSLRDPAAFRMWLNKIIRSVCLRQKRMSMRGGSMPLEDFAEVLQEERIEFLPLKYAEDKEHRDRLISCIDHMSPRYREVILLYYYEGLSMDEIASLTGTSKSAVDHRLRRARDKIRTELEEDRKKAAMYSAVPVVTLALQYDAEALVSSAAVKGLIAASSLTAVSAGSAAAAGSMKLYLAVSIGAAVLTASVATLGIMARVQNNIPALPDGSRQGPPVSQASPPAGFGPGDASSPTFSGESDILLPGETAEDPRVTERLPASPGDTPAQGGPEAPVSTAPNVPPEAASPSRDPQPSGEKPLPRHSGAVDTAVSGKVAVVDRKNALLQQGGRYLAGAILQCRNAHGELLDVATLQENGAFTFPKLPVAEEGWYTISLLLPSPESTTYSSANPNGEAKVHITPGEACRDISIAVRDTLPPGIGVVFYMDDDQPGEIDPVRAGITVSDALPVKIKWTVLKDGGEVAAGAGAHVAIPLNQLKAAGHTGELVLQVNATDAAGNTSTRTAGFYVR